MNIQNNENSTLSFYNDKKNYEVERFNLSKDETLSYDALLDNLILSEVDEKIAIHNITNFFKTILVESDNYSVQHFLSDGLYFSEELKTNSNLKPEHRYLSLFSHCPEITLFLSDEDLMQQLIALLSHYAAKQRYFLIEYINIEIFNNVTYGITINEFQPMDINVINNYIYNLQPFRVENKDVAYSDMQKHFISMFLLNKAIAVAEGVLSAEKLLQEKTGLKF